MRGFPNRRLPAHWAIYFGTKIARTSKRTSLNELGNLEDPSTYNQIVAGLDQHQPDEVHTAAIEELDSLGDKRAIHLLQPFLTDRDEDVRNAAQSAIDSLNDQ